ncbi:MAG: zinc-dependent alcohol dehydrogenase family protein, partial [Pseudomonadota bacterium]
VPAVEPGHLVVKVAATSINTVDTMIRSMGSDLPLSPTLPAVLGMDFAGKVEAVGEGVSQFTVGDEVYGCAGGLLALPGALAEYMLADARLVAHKPKSLSMREAAALPLVGITAYEGLTRAGVSRDQSVLIQGGAGGVGHVAVQLARHFGARVCATGSGEEQMALITQLGAQPIDYKQQSTAEYVAAHTQGAGFDVVFDTVGGANMASSFEAARLNGHVASTVALVQIDLSTAHFKGLSLHVVFMLIPMIHDVDRDKHGAILKSLAEIVDSGHLRPVLDASRYELDQVGEAYERLIKGGALGKVVVAVA